MEKISKIVPSNSRIETVDLSKNKNSRVKLPGMGRESFSPSERLPGASLSAVDRIKFTDEYKALKPNEERHLKIVEKVQNDFFKVYNKTGAFEKKPLNLVEWSSAQEPTASENEMPINVAELENLDMNNVSDNSNFQLVEENPADLSSTLTPDESIELEDITTPLDA